MNIEKKYRIASFATAFVIFALVLLPCVISDGGIWVYYGDYVEQQIPFYYNCIQAIHNGETAWNWHVDMGINFVGSYSFYTLGSPFFWFAALFPAEVSGYLLAPLLAVKIGLCSLFAFMYIRRFVNKPQSAFIGGLLYAFSSYSMYNLVFNHFHEVICFFPLLLIALEEAVVNKRRGVFAAAVALSALVNYFFFVGECVFLVIYVLCRMATSSEFRIRIKDFFCLAVESITGVMISCVLLLPSVMQVVGGNKAGNILSGYNFIVYEHPQRYVDIIKSMFYAADTAGENSFFNTPGSLWDSCAAYLPLFSMVGVLAFFFSRRKHWAKPLLAVSLIMAFVPGFNSVFTMVNAAYYARWYYMPILVCCLATVRALEDFDISAWKKGVAVDGIIAGVLFLLLIFHPVDRSYYQANEFGDEEYVKLILPRFMTELPVDMIFVFAAITGAMLLAVYILIRYRERMKPRLFMKAVTVSTIVCSMALCISYVAQGRADNYHRKDYKALYDTQFEIDDDSEYRVDIVNDYFIANQSILWDMYSPTCFHSIVPNSVYDIYAFAQLSEYAEMRKVDYIYTGMRSLTGVKYVLIDNTLVEATDDSSSISDILPGFEVIDEQNGYYIAENTYAIPMAYAYDRYVLNENTEDMSYVDGFDVIPLVDRMMVECVALNNEQAQKYSDILTELPEEELDKDIWTFERLDESAAERREAGALDFRFGKNSFSAVTDYPEDELVVFSVPYDKGWTVCIDGNAVEADKVNGGFIAVRVPAGRHNIEAVYTIPYFREGIIISVAGIVILAAWCVLWYAVLKKGVQRYCGRVTAHDDYIKSII